MLGNVTSAKDASAALDSYNPPQKLYRELKAKLAELRGQGDGPVIQIAEGPELKYTSSRNRKQQPTVVMEDAARTAASRQARHHRERRRHAL